MANWKKKEAGFIVVRNKNNVNEFFIDKFHNKNEMELLEHKYSWLHADYEYHVGTFNSNDEIEIAIANYQPIKVEQPVKITNLHFPRATYRYRLQKIGELEPEINWVENVSQKYIDEMDLEEGYIMYTEERLDDGPYKPKDQIYNLKDFDRIFIKQGGK